MMVNYLMMPTLTTFFFWERRKENKSCKGIKSVNWICFSLRATALVPVLVYESTEITGREYYPILLV